MKAKLSAHDKTSDTSDHHPDPEKNVPEKKDDDNDCTRPKPGITDPQKSDPTRIEEPGKNDPTRKPDPHKTGSQ